MDSNGLPLTPELWQSLSPREAEIMFATGLLTGDVAARAWGMAGRPGTCPDRLIVMINKADVERLIAGLSA